MLCVVGTCHGVHTRALSLLCTAFCRLSDRLINMFPDIARVTCQPYPSFGSISSRSCIVMPTVVFAYPERLQRIGFGSMAWLERGGEALAVLVGTERPQNIVGHIVTVGAWSLSVLRGGVKISKASAGRRIEISFYKIEESLMRAMERRDSGVD
jgi:hypothetical protein